MAHRQISCTPSAPPTSVVAGDDYRITVLTEGLIRFEYATDGVFEDRPSTFVIHRDLPSPKFRIIQHDEEGVQIITTRLHLTYSRGPFTASSLTAQVLGNVSDWKSRWRYGEKGMWNLGGTSRTLDDIDGRMEVEDGILSRYGYAEIDDSETMLLTEDGWVIARRPGGDRKDGYLFAYGNDYKEAMRDFYRVSGPTPLLPRWALGNWWSRFFPYSDKAYIQLMDRFAQEEVPLSVAVIDVDWHLIHDERVQCTGSSGWTGYTWNDTLFPDPIAFMAELHRRNVQITLNDHPADGVYSFEDAYPEMVKAMGLPSSTTDPIPFDVTDPTFLAAFFDVLRRPREREGCDFWWMDWQQGKHSRQPGLDPLWMLNHYSYLDNSLDGKRPLHFSRYTGPGSHRYPIGFSGDTYISWPSLEFQPEFTATASNMGYGWWSHDIGGHRGGMRDDELQARWVQFGVFSPIMRLHSTAGLWNGKEPWTYSRESARTQADFLRFRHRLLPYLYSMNIRANRGIPLCLPMYWEWAKWDEAYTVPNQYYFGSELIVVPITSKLNAVSRKASVRAWLPPGRYVDIFNETIYDGVRHVWFHRTLEQVPCIAPVGAVIPLDAALVPENGCLNVSAFEVLIVVGKDGEFVLYEDDNAGDPQIRQTKITFNQKYGTITVSATKDLAGLPSIRDWTFRFLAVPMRQANCTVNAKSRKVEGQVVGHGCSFKVQGVPINAELEVDIGPEPTVVSRDVRSQLQSTINMAQVDFTFKEWVWKALDPEASRLTMIARLHSLPLEKAFMDTLMEILLAEE